MKKKARKSDVSFVILSHNDSDMVIKAVRSIENLRTRYSYDIFVVDNGSKDGTADKVEDTCSDATVIRLPNNIGTAAYDAAIEKSQARYIYFTGCDIEVKEDMLDKLLMALQKDKKAALAAPKYLSLKDRKSVDLGGTWLSRSFYSGTFKDNTLGNSIQEIPYIGTGLIRRSSIDRWGYLFDNTYFFYGEDVDLGMRLRLAGEKILYVPEAIVYHKGSVSRSIHRPATLTYLMERNLLRTLLTSSLTKDTILFFPYALAMRIPAMMKDILTLHPLEAGARLIAILWLPLHLPIILKKKRQVRKRRAISGRMLKRAFTERHLWKRFSPFR